MSIISELESYCKSRINGVETLILTTKDAKTLTQAATAEEVYSDVLKKIREFKIKSDVFKIAKAWASVDGRDFEENEEGYLRDAEELLRRAEL
ncbi:MAG: hypothetical protein HRU28_13305 [Rhizobiales bacterium]|nr:hypothetical protein [Hyphomicrobiales bacterium]